MGKKQLPLPVHLIDRIFDELGILDRCCFALCSKSLLNQAAASEHLDYILAFPPSREELQTFFEIRLGRGWVNGSARYCVCCGKFASTDAVEWRLISERFTRERSGYVADLWRDRRNDGWLRYWIERWCVNESPGEDSAESSIRREDKTILLCPRCAVMDPDNNDWRRHISGADT